ncbi:FAD/NAD(P)-binding protein [Methylobacterium planeticum]|uniref:Pyridine nucleotide-disulfide oxidoreductase n=1 Tax=Methylobacterium planeticum TaxID=2615211 RepID=A0A6N6MPM6_9HYPH|nr:FAD/NAD(P)-binding protein [Methylobacterium planeticum]KAB1072965.1 pyridine nucleotide-disulfide oxidoreductase [Methylobacterium planeticum]
MAATQPARPIAVIGAGFSGTMAAIQLLATLPRDRAVLLCERGGRFGRGLAYGTGASAHLLNLRAGNMSAFPDRPRHFEDWLAALAEGPAEGVRATPAGTFAPRGLYGRYLTELLTDAVTRDGLPRLHLLNDTVSDLAPDPEGFRLRTEGGQTHAVAGAVLAMGNLGAAGEPRSRHRLDPWQPERLGRLHPHLPVLIVGTGLTMVDTVATLRDHGFAGPIVAVSRRGLLPSAHAAAAPWPIPALSAADVATLPALLRRVRREVAAAEAAGIGWRGVIDALRPVTDTLWRSLPPAERARFLRHLRPFWDVHRHRTAPPAAEMIAREIAAGGLSVGAARILSVVDAPAHAAVTLRPRGAGETLRLDVQAILDATGIGRVGETEDPLLRRLIARGLVRPGPFGIGLDAGPDYRVLGTRPGPRLWTLGPLLRGVLWECLAVPDIRNEAADLAGIVAAELDRAEAA